MGRRGLLHCLSLIASHCFSLIQTHPHTYSWNMGMEGNNSQTAEQGPSPDPLGLSLSSNSTKKFISTAPRLPDLPDQIQIRGRKGFSQFSPVARSVVSDSLRPHGLQHARPPCPSPTPAVYSNSCPLSW